MQPQRLLVPLFQRPYVWNEEMQWEPLWKDLERVATRLLTKPLEPQLPHFLGAVVLQQMQSQTGNLQQRTVIDGQQRLTTLQLLLDALHAELTRIGEDMPAARLKQLIANDQAFRQNAEDRFKVWPTNRDRDAFNEVMAAPPPVDYATLTHRNSRLAKAHAFFAGQARTWLESEGSFPPSARAEALERSARELLQIVVIDLNASENAQEIFETLNARGSVLTAADLIKNLVFQRMLEQGADVDKAYHLYWEQFETAFWEEEISVGRVSHPRSSVFLNHWLIARTGEEVVAREVFSRFKAYADYRSGATMLDLLKDIHRAAGIYRAFSEQAGVLEGSLNRLGMFAYRLKTMENEVAKPVLLALLDRPTDPMPAPDLDKSLDVLESWLVRRMLVRATAKSYNKLLADVAALVRDTPSHDVATAIESFFAVQRAEIAYWPDDDELRRELAILPAYRKFSRSRLRMVLEAIEDDWRGFRRGQTSAAGMRIKRGSYAIEHVLPQSWHKHWPLPDDLADSDRDDRVHRLGNLTLLTTKLNSAVSNGPWLGKQGKATQLQANDVLLLNSRLLKSYGHTDWDEPSIDERTEAAIATLLNVWPVPIGHKVDTTRAVPGANISVDIADLLIGSLLVAGQVLHSQGGKYGGNTATVLHDGRLEVGGVAYNSPSLAGNAVRGKATNGWYFWRLAPESRRSLDDLRREYLRAFGREEAVDSDESQNLYFRFWTRFSEVLSSSTTALKPHKPAPQNWTTLAIGRTGFWLCLVTAQRDDKLAVELVLNGPQAKTRFAALKSEREAIEAALGFDVEWDEAPDSVQSRVRCIRLDAPPDDEARWPEYLDWLIIRSVRMADVFRDRVRALP